MLNFHNPYADEEEPETEPEPHADPDAEVIRRIRQNIAKIKENQDAAAPEEPAYSRPDPTRVDGLMVENEAFIKALVGIHLAILANGQQPAGNGGFRFVGGDSGEIRILPADEAGTDIGGFRVKEFPFAKWLLENYRAELETLRNSGRTECIAPEKV